VRKESSGFEEGAAEIPSDFINGETKPPQD